MIALELRCCGCDATAAGDLHRDFEPLFHGGDSGLGRWVLNVSAPDGWVPFDPYTNVTYCPSCWDEIAASPQHAGPDPQ